MAARNLGSTGLGFGTSTAPAPSAAQPADASVAEAFLASTVGGEHVVKRHRARFHELAVAEVRPLTADAVEVTFTVPEELADDYTYLPGQYVALRKELDGHERRRSYSICRPPERGSISVAIKRDLGGIFSSWANSELQAGDTLDVMSPQGTFTSTLDALDGKHIVGIAAGSGITPLMALAHTVLSRSATAEFELVYTNRSTLDVMFLEELAELKDRYPSRLAVHHVLSREQRTAPLLSGRIDAEKLGTMLDVLIRPETVDEWFLCGPFELVQLARDTLAANGVPADHVRYELFTTDADRVEPRHGRPVDVKQGEETVAIEFTLDGQSSTVESPVSANESILNAALRVRPDVPFACAGGVCGTCRARLVEGSVNMTENYALEPDELERGYVLTCQSHPKSDRVVVDYDV
ncbi:1,2-phenylacetyl-CoA epoxidase subunit PaaE [Agromyces mariniharenae]|uniref:Phenylacetate-CoA oxygenase/reductase subunit PaaK n=1 Tax=Agromyces mariniharenae TaxID=2604423 RepID=A0A5S4V4L0_9MICO|nr:1,2-phenylacetyl-CoA epoxidase subunit PaaE [Agromyces mariniharenae]TYL53934.1 phenylacetate-CoA oxygenase/reductase subunit PaaK [Agromyces mariniharenae]